MQKGIFVILVVIAFLLGANLYQGKESHAAKTYQYRVVGVRNDGNQIAQALNDNAKGGWEFVGPAAVGEYFIFKK